MRRLLLLLRHGKADRHSAGGDRERPLTSRGEDDARHLGQYIQAEFPAPDLAVASDARRAKRTLDLALKAFSHPPPQIVDNSLYLATVDHLLETLRQTPDKVTTLLAVGHNPGFGELAITLAGAGDSEELAELQMKFPTCALAALAFDVDHWAMVQNGAGRLERFVSPAKLREDPNDDHD